VGSPAQPRRSIRRPHRCASTSLCNDGITLCHEPPASVKQGRSCCCLKGGVARHPAQRQHACWRCGTALPGVEKQTNNSTLRRTGAPSELSRVEYAMRSPKRTTHSVQSEELDQPGKSASERVSTVRPCRRPLYRSVRPARISRAGVLRRGVARDLPATRTRTSSYRRGGHDGVSDARP